MSVNFWSPDVAWTQIQIDDPPSDFQFVGYCPLGIASGYFQSVSAFLVRTSATGRLTQLELETDGTSQTLGQRTLLFGPPPVPGRFFLWPYVQLTAWSAPDASDAEGQMFGWCSPDFLTTYLGQCAPLIARAADLRQRALQTYVFNLTTGQWDFTGQTPIPVFAPS